MTYITPILIAVVSGARLWPLLRKNYPKQFFTLSAYKPLFQSSAKCLTSFKAVRFDAPITVTNSDFRLIVKEQLQGLDVDPGTVLT
jgi:mannose-1-phosphate guanylyltransferase / mannose-6-phosphate isomerase